MPRILIVDDDVQIRDLLRIKFELEGFDVSAAADGNEALALHSKEPFKMVITDIIMPEKDGIETITEISKINPGTKIIAMSGGGRITPKSYLLMAKQFGAARTFTKPVNLKELVTAVRDLLENTVSTG